MSVTKYQRWAFSIASEAMLIGSIGLAWLAMGGWITDEFEKRLRKRLTYTADTGLQNLPDDEPVPGISDGKETVTVPGISFGIPTGGGSGGGTVGGGEVGEGGGGVYTIWYNRRAETSLSAKTATTFSATTTTTFTASTTSTISSTTANPSSLATSAGAVDPRCTSCDVSVLIVAFLLGGFCE